MTAAQIRRRGRIAFILGAQLLVAMAAITFAVYPALDAHGWADRDEHRLTVQYTTAEDTP